MLFSSFDLFNFSMNSVWIDLILGLTSKFFFLKFVHDTVPVSLHYFYFNFRLIRMSLESNSNRTDRYLLRNIQEYDVAMITHEIIYVCKPNPNQNVEQNFPWRN